MTTRITWMTAKMPAGLLGRAVKKLQDDKYDEDKGAGFRMQRIRRDGAVGSFFEKVETPGTIVDPFGKEVLTNRVEYRRTEFAISDYFPELELTNAPRGLRAFFARVSDHFEYQTAFVSLTTDPLLWIDAIVEPKGRALVTALKVGSIPLSTTASAEVVIEGTQDVRREVKKLLADRKYVVKALDAHVTVGSLEFTCTLGSDGKARLEESSEGGVRLIRDALRSAGSTVLTG
jgi:hypothetical protein